ncbi:DUF3305 domain-containing protein [Antarcticirhabdus aurantiaca]|uniref:DUF3305 domain-containing protein n=1 Tax=Antarcticirhabdus aurantiaca TaxID=2606717 RepID=A0ACD4NVX2_9HYPH|nr:DUF3305 domain-containing protein [Antarcticirhabdus aurantiaca]WAJ30784.1 DUF3305 domain-containing protein [Jeongeuplla avenae]
MTHQTFRVGVVVARRPSASPWTQHSWRVAAIVPEAPSLGAGQVLGEEGAETMIYAGTGEVEFHRVETANYRDNLVAGRPSLWVTLEPVDGEPGIRLVAVTADPAEGESMTEAGELLVEVAPMPPEMAEALAAFVREHHVERVFTKRKRE